MTPLDDVRETLDICERILRAKLDPDLSAHLRECKRRLIQHCTEIQLELLKARPPPTVKEARAKAVAKTTAKTTEKRITTTGADYCGVCRGTGLWEGTGCPFCYGKGERTT